MSNLRQVSGQVFSALVNAFLPSHNSEHKPEPEHKPVEKKNGIDNLDDLRSFVDSRYIVVNGTSTDVESGEISKHTGYLKMIRKLRLKKTYNKIPFQYWFNESTATTRGSSTKNGLATFYGEVEAILDEVEKIYRFRVRGATKSEDLLLSGNWSSDKNIPILAIYDNSQPKVETRSWWDAAAAWISGAAATVVAGAATVVAGTGDAAALAAMYEGYAAGTLSAVQLSTFEAEAAATFPDVTLPVFGDCTAADLTLLLV